MIKYHFVFKSYHFVTHFIEIGSSFFIIVHGLGIVVDFSIQLHN